MNVLIVSSCTIYSTVNYLVSAFKKGGHRVFVYSDTANDQADMIGKGIIVVKKILKKSQFSPDLLFFVEGGTMKVFPMGLEELTIMTAWYGIDTHMDYEKHLRIGRVFDVTFVAQQEYVTRLKLDGLKQVFWLPLAAAPELYTEEPTERVIDIAFVGSNDKAHTPMRFKLLKAITQNFTSVFIGAATPMEMAKAYQKAKIVFNQSVNNDINMRYFEATAAGALLVTEATKSNGVEELFTLGKDLIEYHNENDLIGIITFYLKNESQRIEIANRAKELVLTHHTYQNRVDQIIGNLEVCKKLVSPGKDLYFSIFAVLRLPLGMLKISFDLMRLYVHSKTKKLTRFIGLK